MYFIVYYGPSFIDNFPRFCTSVDTLWLGLMPRFASFVKYLVFEPWALGVGVGVGIYPPPPPVTMICALMLGLRSWLVAFIKSNVFERMALGLGLELNPFPPPFDNNLFQKVNILIGSGLATTPTPS